MDCDDLARRVGDPAASDPEAAGQRVVNVVASPQRSVGAPFGGGYGEPPVTVKDLEAAARRASDDEQADLGSPNSATGADRF